MASGDEGRKLQGRRTRTQRRCGRKAGLLCLSRPTVWLVLKCGGRKPIVALNGSEILPTNKPRPDGTLVKALARAWRWERMLDEGVYSSVSEIGDTENISKSYVSRILRLALLAPDIVEGILAGRANPAVTLGTFARRLPEGWKEQRRLLTVEGITV